MTTVVAEVYDALREAGASEEKARKAAETIADYDNEFSEIKTELKVHRWILGSLQRSAPATCSCRFRFSVTCRAELRFV